MEQSNQKNLFAIAYDSYKSTLTSEGVIYNIVDDQGVVITQCCVSHKRFTLHDLLIQTDSGAPNSTRRALQTLLDERFDCWRMISAFSPTMIKNSERLTRFFFDEDSTKLMYDPKESVVKKTNANQNILNGF